MTESLSRGSERGETSVEVTTCAKKGNHLSYLLLANDSSLPSVNFRFLGWGLCTKVHS